MTNSPTPREVAEGLTEAQRIYLLTLQDDPTPTKEVRAETYGPDWWDAGYWDDESQLLTLDLVMISLPIEHSMVWLTTKGSAVRSILSGKG